MCVCVRVRVLGWRLYLREVGGERGVNEVFAFIFFVW